MLQFLPKIIYDLSIAGEAPRPVVIPDITVRVNFQLSSAQAALILQDYQVLEAETPESISYKLYGTQDYHWTVMMVNQRFDYVSDFPVSQEALLQFCQDKYGVDAVDNIHHYEDANGNITDMYTYDWKNSLGGMPSGVSAETPIWRTYNQYGDTAQYLGPWQTDTAYYPGDVVHGTSVLGTQAASMYWICQLHHTSALDGINEPLVYPALIYPNGYPKTALWLPWQGGGNWVQLKTLLSSPITNFQYEDRMNENKRMLKVVKPQYIGQFVQQYAAAVQG